MSTSSEVFLGYKDAKDYGRKIIAEQYPPKCDKVKMHKKAAIRNVELGHLAGEADGAMEALNLMLTLADEPYEVILGEIQLFARNRWNNLHAGLTRNGQKTTLRPVSIDDIAALGQEALDAVRKEKENGNDMAGVAERDGDQCSEGEAV